MRLLLDFDEDLSGQASGGRRVCCTPSPLRLMGSRFSCCDIQRYDGGGWLGDGSGVMEMYKVGLSTKATILTSWLWRIDSGLVLLGRISA